MGGFFNAFVGSFVCVIIGAFMVVCVAFCRNLLVFLSVALWVLAWLVIS